MRWNMSKDYSLHMDEKFKKFSYYKGMKSKLGIEKK